MTKVITYGTFDLFHEGHYNLLKQAKALGDYLIVGVTTEHFDEARGKINVVDDVLTRVENVRKTGLADEIIIEDHEGQKIEDIQKYGIDIFTVGSDWIGTFDYLNAFCKVIYVRRTPNVSSTIKRKNLFKIVNLGVVGTGRIVPRFISEIKYVSGIGVSCAYNPADPVSVLEFQKDHNIDVITGSYEEFLNRIDAVYVGSPNETHYEYVRKALEAGKHVLSEKPVAFTKREAVELYQLAEEKGLVLLEGVRTAYCPGFSQMINVARSGVIGEIRDVEATYTRLASLNSRERTDAKYGGAFLEFGPSTLLPIVKLMGTDFKDIRIRSIIDDNGVDIFTKVDLQYDHGLATARCGVGVKAEGQLVISGTNGYILAESPWWLTRKFDIRYEDSSKVDHFEPTFQGDGFRYEISEFVSKINKIDRSNYKLTSQESIAMSEITEIYMRERNVE